MLWKWTRKYLEQLRFAVAIEEVGPWAVSTLVVAIKEVSIKEVSSVNQHFWIYSWKKKLSIIAEE